MAAKAQADTLDLTVAFLAKRDGIDKAGLCLGVCIWALIAVASRPTRTRSWVLPKTLPGPPNATAALPAAPRNCHPAAAAAAASCRCCCLLAPLGNSSGSPASWRPLESQTLKILRYTTRLLLATTFAGSQSDLARRLKRFEASVATSRCARARTALLGLVLAGMGCVLELVLAGVSCHAASAHSCMPCAIRPTAPTPIPHRVTSSTL